ncbi:hypothetical protein [Nocardioides campestrisoli]|uniref:hypothetical protein n=1 Tax=Nocardioides campestrisoli TaxID=2736757 RepID=UPI0015E7AA09|nr:hypothetical protein [Nocardioides campestrisoli]
MTRVEGADAADGPPPAEAVRRLGRLEAGTGGVTVLTGVAMAGHLIGPWTPDESLAWGVGAGSGTALLWLLVRLWIPARPTMAATPAKQSEGEAAEQLEAEDWAEDGDGDSHEGGWDLSGLLLACVVVPLVVVLGLVIQGWPLVLLVGGFAFATPDVDAGQVLRAFFLSLGVVVLFEVAVSVPLMRRWGMDPG